MSEGLATRLARWFRPPRRTLLVFLCLMMVLGTALGLLGWQVIERDRLAEQGRVQEHLELATDHVCAALQSRLANLDRRVTAGADLAPGNLPEGVLVLRATPRSLTVHSDASLLYQPSGAAYDEPAGAIFAKGEALEFRRNNPAAASEMFRKLVRSPRPDVRRRSRTRRSARAGPDLASSAVVGCGRQRRHAGTEGAGSRVWQGDRPGSRGAP
jgi:hypothetical protein